MERDFGRHSRGWFLSRLHDESSWFQQIRAQVIAPALTPQQIATYKPTHTAHETTPDDILSSPHNRNHSDHESDLPDLLDL